ncbi:PE-PGRS family protein [Amycolatopsis sp. MJM2582]|uniref:PE-PGRS family protein n=1 Tax=Amycolatopsis sp. MJM2582 TaxID=1427749 RepID=UPI00126A260B|nr:PE-PGRS family protein [Amycolatopsis sp. MJM2582]
MNGDHFELDHATVTSRLRGHTPHWVEIEATRFPVKQALETVLGISRTTFTSHTARHQFDRLGFTTSTASSNPTTKQTRPSAAIEPAVPDYRSTVDEAARAFATLVAFLRTGPLTTGISTLEHNLLNADRTTAGDITAAAGLTEELLHAALTVRRDVGRVSDVIHATVITLALPHILEDGEVVSNRPSLGPGNDQSRPFDLETNKRVAEFKVAVWSGGDMMRKRGITQDLVHLALHEDQRRPELWVAGTDPIRFLQTSTSPVGSLFSRASRRQRARYEARYGNSDIPLRDFVTEHAARVQLRNIADALPALAEAFL